MAIRNLAERTIDAYTYHVRRFADFIEKPLGQAACEDVRTFQLHLIQERKLAYSSFNQAVCALRFYYRHTQPMPWPVSATKDGLRGS
ncbi:phage integrase N-terminal SAM-like domain-containing protein [Stieleria sp. ICT_E10.1]|uniref:site-specific integrase n=1 Tax=Stieleria sedimenti TaxID=2976331 RepID=UPI00217FDB7E|nr:site-specific integrase [Stieleria sedimenti]MCS7470334.1 phage integrase N-terminal SAM-like domain-containing protein [Stieleria sedimenti]